jgi:hypothetical protein
MGLDGVELLLAVEDAFQIHIADEEAGNVATVGDLHNLVVDRLHAKDAKACLTSAAFYRVRRGIIDTLKINRRDIRPSTPLETILPRDSRRQRWRDLQQVVRLKVPDLQHPGWIQLSMFAAGVALAAAVGVYLRVGLGGTLLISSLGLVVGPLLLNISPRLADAFPNRVTTVGDLARDVLALNHARLAAETGSWTKQDGWETLCRLITLQTGVDASKIKPDSLIVGDLGIE